jgi:hypothetical protein
MWRATPTRCGAGSAWRSRRPGSTRARRGASCSSSRGACSASRRRRRLRAPSTCSRWEDLAWSAILPGFAVVIALGVVMIILNVRVIRSYD